MKSSRNRSSFLVSTSVVALTLFAGSVAWAVLPSGAVDDLKKDASEKIRLQITKVERLPSSRSAKGYINLQYTAKVTKVDRSKSRLKVGATITIKAYHWTVPFDGPANPPLLKKGWKGGMYLNAVDADKAHFKLAAYGNSLY